MARLEVMFVTPEPLAGPQHLAFGGIAYYLRSRASGLKSLAVDFVFLAPDCTDEQRKLAECRIKAKAGKLRDLSWSELRKWLRMIGHPGGKDET